MVDTVKTLPEILAQLPDNTGLEISPQDLRDQTVTLHRNEQFDTVALLLADTRLTTSNTTVGDIIEAQGFRYEVVASGGDVVTAGGVELGVHQDNKEVYPEMIADNAIKGTTDMTSAIAASDVIARTNGVPLVLAGDYRTTSTITFTAQTIITHDTYIIKDLDDTEVVRFQSNTGGATGQFKTHAGRLMVTQSSTPSGAQTSAHGFVMEDVVLRSFGQLEVGHCAYGLVNDSTSLHAGFWGNYIRALKVRGCKQGYLHLPSPGSGAHTENFIATAYFNGKEVNTSTLLPKENSPILVDSAEGLTFGTLNFEWTKVNGGGAFIAVLNNSTMIINTFHFEGNVHNASGDAGIFGVFNSGTDNLNIVIGNMHINSFVQTDGTVSLLSATTVSAGKLHLESMSGVYTSNTFTDFRILDTDGPITVSLGAKSGWEDYFTSIRKGNIPTGFKHNVYFGGVPDEAEFAISNPGATIDVGDAGYMRLTGTGTANISTITLANRESQRHGVLLIENRSSAAISFESGGNILFPVGYASPQSLGIGKQMLLTLDTTFNRAHLVSLT